MEIMIESKENLGNIENISFPKEYWKDWESFEKNVFDKIFFLQKDGSFLDVPNRAIVLKDGHKTQNLGIENTAKEQSIKFYELIKRECKRSVVYRELVAKILEERLNNEHLVPITFHVAKNSSSFIDSAVDWAMDAEELEMFGEDLDIHESGQRIGLNRGEVLMHVLEERFYMQFPDTDFEKSHIKCLTEGSFQSRYRQEMGARGSHIYFDLCEKFNHSSQVYSADFHSLSTCGSISSFFDCEIVKARYPVKYKDYDPSKIKRSSKLVEFNTHIDKLISEYGYKWKLIIQEKGCPKTLDVKMIEHCISHRFPKEEKEKAIAKHVKSYAVGFYRLKTWRSISTKWKFVCQKQNVPILLNKEHMRNTLFSYFVKNVRKHYSWEYDEKSWQNEKQWMANEWIDSEIQEIKKSIAPNIVSKLVYFKIQIQKQAEATAASLLSEFESLF